MSELRRRVAEHYSADAEGFADYWAPVLREMSSALLGHLPLERARRVLDLGCGTGGLIPDLRLVAPNATVVGLDLAEGMLAVAKRQTGAPLAVAAAEQLPLRAGCADVAVFSFVLHRLPDPVAALSEAAWALRPGGAVGTVTGGVGGGGGAAHRAWRDEVDALRLPPEPPVPAFHALLDSPEKVERALREAGFADARAWTRRFERRSTRDEWLRTQLGHPGSRLRALSPERWRGFEQRVRERVRSLPPDEFASYSEATLGLGYTAADPS